MPKSNEKYFETKVNWYRQLFTLFFAVEAACIGWLISNYDKTVIAILILDILVILGVVCILGLMIIKVRKYTKLMRE